MKNNPSTLALVLCAALSLPTTSALAARLGDPAQKLTIKDWVKGTPVDVTDGKQVYVVEFWATWCGPCKVSIPHLTEMQAKFKDKGVVFVGISDETVDKVKPFVEKMGDKMNYTVACDDDRKSNAGYMAAYEQGGIPTAFIVGKDKKVLWFGHPMGELESTLEAVVKGTYDIAAAIKKDEARAELADYNKLASAGDPKAAALGQKILKSLPDEVEALSDFAFGIVANVQSKHRDFALANAALDRAEKVAGSKNAQVLGTRSIALFESGKQAEGLELAKQAVALCTDPKKLPMYKNFVRVMESRLKAKSSDQPGKKEPAKKEPAKE